MKASDTKRHRPEPIPIQKPEEARANRSYIIVPPAKPAVKKEHADGEAVSGS